MESKKLFLVDVTTSLCVLAEDHKDAVSVAKRFVREDITEADFSASEVTEKSDLPEEWRDSFPWSDHVEKDVTCLQIVEEMEKEKQLEMERNPVVPPSIVSIAGMKGLTDDPTDPRLGKGKDSSPTAQNEAYLVLSDEERKKGFVRPLRQSYIHVGLKPRFPLRDLNEEEKKMWGDSFSKFEEFPESESPKTGRFWTAVELNSKGCGVRTTMSLPLCETYAAKPNFYGSTWCCGCSRHIDVKEFVWCEDGKVVGS